MIDKILVDGRSRFDQNVLGGILLLLLLASSVKPVAEFTEGVPRSYSFLVSTLATFSPLFSLLAIFLSGAFLYKYTLKNFQLPVLGIPTKLFVLLKLWAIMIFAVYGEFPIALFLSFFLTLIISLYLFSFALQDINAFYYIARILALYSAFFIFLNAFEFYLNADSVLWAGRLFGITNHPNFLGGYCAILAPFALLQVIKNKGLQQIFYSFVVLALFIMVLSSGSRSSLASFVLGVLVFSMFNFNPFKALFVIGISSIFLFLAFQLSFDFSQSSGLRYERLLSSENTRSYVNSELWQVYLNSPIFGNPPDAESTANSYLLVLARMGTIGGTLLVLLMLKILQVVYLNWIYCRSDIVYVAYLSSFAAISLYSLFEGVLVENFSLGQCVFFLCLTYFGLNRRHLNAFKN